MAAVTAAVIGATVGVAALANSVEQQNQARRLSGQQANRDRVDANNAIAAQNEEGRQQDRIAVRDRQKSDQERTAAGLAGGGTATLPSPLSASGPGVSTPTNTLLGT